MTYIYTERQAKPSKLYELITSTKVTQYGYYRYTVTESDPMTLSFIYAAILDGLCASKKAFGSYERLSAYLDMTGRKYRICALISSLLTENSVIHVDGIINFRLRDYKNDISAFFDFISYAETIQEAFAAMGQYPSGLFEI